MARALESFHIEGLGQNLPFLSAVMDQDRFRSGGLSTNYIKDEFPQGFGGLPPTGLQLDLLAVVGCAMHRLVTGRETPELLRDNWIVIGGGAAGLVIERGERLLDGGRQLALQQLVQRREPAVAQVQQRALGAEHRGLRIHHVEIAHRAGAVLVERDVEVALRRRRFRPQA